MLMGCLFFILIIVAISLVLSIGISVLPFIALFFLITSYTTYKKYANLSESKMQCPNCNSTNIKITSLRTGSQTQSKMVGLGGILGIFGFINKNKNTNTTYSFKREAICQECGFNYEYLTAEDIKDIKQKNKTRLICSIVFFIIALNIAISFWADSASDETTNDKNIWASKYTALDNFDYYLDGDQVYLKEYEGKSEKVNISSVYEKDGKQYHVVEFADGVFALEDVTSEFYQKD